MSDEKRKRRDNGSHDGVIFPVGGSSLALPKEYASFFKQIKERIKRDRLTAQLSVNSIQMLMYWDLGNDILRKQKGEGWGGKEIVQRTVAQIPLKFYNSYQKIGQIESTQSSMLKELVEPTFPEDSNIHVSEYQLYLPSKEELQQQLAEVEKMIEGSDETKI